MSDSWIKDDVHSVGGKSCFKFREIRLYGFHTKFNVNDQKCYQNKYEIQVKTELLKKDWNEQMLKKNGGKV